MQVDQTLVDRVLAYCVDLLVGRGEFVNWEGQRTDLAFNLSRDEAWGPFVDRMIVGLHEAMSMTSVSDPVLAMVQADDLEGAAHALKEILGAKGGWGEHADLLPAPPPPPEPEPQPEPEPEPAPEPEPEPGE